MVNKQDLLFEIGCEELPAKPLSQFVSNLSELFGQELKQYKLEFSSIKPFATPRRLALLIHDLVIEQDDFIQEKKGPSISAAYDQDGIPTKAAIGFANSCGVDITQLERSAAGFLIFKNQIQGQTTAALLPQICQNVIKKLAIPKPMRWNNRSIEFIRPVHWIVLLFGSQVVEAEILDCKTGRETHGHRFHFPEAIALTSPKDYENALLQDGKVIADFDVRRHKIQQQILQLGENIKARPIVDEALLNEVTGINEWPVALLANFQKDFLKIPAEALISAMKTHQKSFPLMDENNHLLPHFIFVANIQSKNEQQVILGNQRVMHARLSDAAFFFHTDCKHRLESRLDTLKNIIFQAKLGTLFDKSQRVASLSQSIGEQINQPHLAYRAGLLCKTDLVTDMVKEFPELQGIMGYYYAQHDGETSEVAQALRDHYLPRFAGDALPNNATGDAVALADRLDTLVGIFGINQLPTGDKDPFALRRAALGILRILIEHNYNLNLSELLSKAIQGYSQVLPNKEIVTQVQQFIIDRLKAWYSDQNISADTLAAVLEGTAGIDVPLDIHRRVLAVHEFRQLPEAKALTAANKRAANILTKTNSNEIVIANPDWADVDQGLFEHESEAILYAQVSNLMQSQDNFSNNNYGKLLSSFACLREPIDNFFEHVMVLCEDEKIRKNRLAILSTVRKLFLSIADISKLQE